MVSGFWLLETVKKHFAKLETPLSVVKEHLYCEDCKHYKKDSSEYWDRCLHPQSLVPGKDNGIRKEENDSWHHFCEFMRENKCKSGKLFEQMEDTNAS